MSYFRELHGDLDGAVDAMRRAVAAGGPALENVAYVQSLLGGLELARGRLRRGAPRVRRGAGRDAGLRARRRGPRAARRRSRRPAPARSARWRGVVARLPLPEYVIALGETELAAGRAAGRRGATSRWCARSSSCSPRRASNTDVELALFEADHGSPARGVALAARRGRSAPSVRSADALGWALTRAGDPRAGLRWAHRALRLGSLDPMFRFHAGMTALAAGRPAEGRRDLRLALAHGLARVPAARARSAREALP